MSNSVVLLYMLLGVSAVTSQGYIMTTLKNVSRRYVFAEYLLRKHDELELVAFHYDVYLGCFGEECISC